MKTLSIPHTDLVVSRMGYGIAMMDSDWSDAELLSRAVKAIHTAYGEGITLFDTADVYGLGQSDRALAEAIRQSPGMREKIVLQSKCGLRFGGGWTNGAPVRPDSIYTDLSYDHIIRSVEESLGRLKTDYLDILLLHSPDLLLQAEEIARAFDGLQRDGKVRYFGVSSHNQAQIQLLEKTVRQRLITNQIHVSLAHTAVIAESTGQGRETIVDHCRLKDIQVQSWAPLRVTNPAHKSVSFINPPAEASDALKAVSDRLVTMAQAHGTNASAVALAWLMMHPAHIIPIVGSSRPEWIVENCAADRISLTRQQWYELFNAAAPIQS